jgi:hypothetical protein
MTIAWLIVRRIARLKAKELPWRGAKGMDAKDGLPLIKDGCFGSNKKAQCDTGECDGTCRTGAIDESAGLQQRHLKNRSADGKPARGGEGEEQEART